MASLEGRNNHKLWDLETEVARVDQYIPTCCTEEPTVPKNVF